MQNTGEKSDCEVCKRLMKEKHKYGFIWKIACIIFAVLTVIFACLYFGSGAVTTETEITIDNSTIENDGDNNNIVIGNEGEVISGTIERTDYAPIICISVIVASVIIVFGGIIVANHYKKDD